MNAHIRMAAVLVGVLSLASNSVVAQSIPSDAPPSTVLSVGPAPELSYAASEVVKMWQAGVDNDVITTYIDSSTAPYHLDANGIIYAKSVGLPSAMAQAMMRRDVQLQQVDPAFQPPAAMPPPEPTACAVAAPSADSKVVIIGSDPPPPSVQVTVIGQGYPGYNYYYPYQDTFGASSPVVIGSGSVGGFGGGSFHGGWRTACR